MGSFGASWLQEKNFLVIAHSFFCHYSVPAFKHLWYFHHNKNWISSLLFLGRLTQREKLCYVLSPFIRESAPFPAQKSIWHPTESWLCVSLGDCLPLQEKRTFSVAHASRFTLSWGAGTQKAWFLPGTEGLLQGIECPPILCSQKGVDCSWHQSNLDPEDHR